jgi:DNA-binding transcriptional LysR family regulator
MLDGISLDQIRTFVAAVDEGSFSAAGRKLRRAQSVVSQTIANLEGQLGVTLFDRTGRYPRLTAEGRALLADAREVAAGVDGFKAKAKGMAAGLEPELSVAIDVLFPIAAITEAATAFVETFPETPLRVYVEALGAVVQPVLDGRCSLGVVGTLALVPESFSRERLANIEMVAVASPRHPLARYGAPIPTDELARHVQLVLTDRSELSRGREFGVLSPRSWRIADLGAKHAFLRAGLGWGGMPLGAVERDIADGTLVPIHVEDIPPDGSMMPMSAVWRSDTPLGPAGRWLVDRLKSSGAQDDPAREPVLSPARASL